MLIPIPFRTDRPRIRFPYLTAAVIAACALLHAYGSLELAPVVTGATFGGEHVVVQYPALVYHYGLWGSRPSFAAFFTYQFIHANWLHLVGNMLFLWVFGSLIEDALRPLGFAILYLSGGIMAGVSHILMSQMLGLNVETPLVGASGSIAAIMGLFALRFYRTRVGFGYFSPVPGRLGWSTLWLRGIWAMLIWVGLQVVEGIVDAAHGGPGGVAHWAHVGGFLAGVVAAPLVGGVKAAKDEFITDDPDTNVEYVRRSELCVLAQRALRADPTNPYLMWKLAQAYRHAGEYEDATRVYQQTVQRFASRRMTDQASKAYLELLEYNDGATVAPAVLSQIAGHLETTDVRRAMDAYQDLTVHHPTRKEAEFAWVRMATIYDQTYRRPHEALRCLDEFLRRYPKSEWAAQATTAREGLQHEIQKMGPAFF